MMEDVNNLSAGMIGMNVRGTIRDMLYTHVMLIDLDPPKAEDAYRTARELADAAYTEGMEWQEIAQQFLVFDLTY